MPDKDKRAKIDHVREQLLDLIIQAKIADTEDVPFSEFLADFLLANGVTFGGDINVPGRFVTDNNDGCKWIPVTEQLPESGVRVIVCRGDKVEQGVFLGVNGWWKVYGTNIKNVTHWMPLPEPPKEES